MIQYARSTKWHRGARHTRAPLQLITSGESSWRSRHAPQSVRPGEFTVACRPCTPGAPQSHRKPPHCGTGVTHRRVRAPHEAPSCAMHLMERTARHGGGGVAGCVPGGLAAWPSGGPAATAQRTSCKQDCRIRPDLAHAFHTYAGSMQHFFTAARTSRDLAAAPRRSSGAAALMLASEFSAAAEIRQRRYR